MTKPKNRLEWKMAEIVYLDPEEEVKPYVNNNKQHPKEQIDNLVLQISKFGFDQPAIINGDGVLIKGHGRRLACIQLEIKLPCIIRDDLTEYEEMAMRIGDNAVARSGWDEDNLRFELGTLSRNEPELLDYVALEEKEVTKYLQEDDLTVDEGGGGGTTTDQEPQFIVSVECESEEQMAALYERLKGEGFTCNLIMS